MAKWLHNPEQLLFEVRNKVAYITLNRPEKRNALSLQLHRELVAALMEADDLNEVRVIVIQGAGVDFSAGADVAGGPVNTVGAGYD
ncbi:MAG: enoyl-CoA hydratase, partial [Rhizobiaceae bacterium]